MTISLPKDPSGEEYEDLVATLLSVGGHFVEAQLKLRDEGKEILELDIVASPVGSGVQDRRLFEVKKRAFSFNDMFKLFGQRTFLSIEEAVLVSAAGCATELLPVYQQRAAEMGISLCHLELDAHWTSQLGRPPNGLDEERWKLMSRGSWFGSIGRRLALGALREDIQLFSEAPELEAPRRYEFNTRASFFLGTALERAEALYNAYFATPRMSEGVVSFEAGRRGLSENQIWPDVRDRHHSLAIQAVMDLESKGRIGIVKNALDDFLV